MNEGSLAAFGGLPGALHTTTEPWLSAGPARGFR